MNPENLFQGNFYFYKPPYTGQTRKIYKCQKIKNTDGKFATFSIEADSPNSGGSIGQTVEFNKIEIERYIEEIPDLNSAKSLFSDCNFSEELNKS